MAGAINSSKSSVNPFYDPLTKAAVGEGGVANKNSLNGETRSSSLC